MRPLLLLLQKKSGYEHKFIDVRITIDVCNDDTFLGAICMYYCCIGIAEYLVLSTYIFVRSQTQTDLLRNNYRSHSKCESRTCTKWFSLRNGIANHTPLISSDLQKQLIDTSVLSSYFLDKIGDAALGGVTGRPGIYYQADTAVAFYLSL